MKREEQIKQEAEEQAKELYLDKHNLKWMFRHGCEWMLEHLWKDAQGDDLPPIDKEVIVLCYNGKVCFGHRPDPKGFDCKNIDTGKIEYLEPMTYDKGGWNIPDIKYWLDLDLPNLEDLV